MCPCEPLPSGVSGRNRGLRRVGCLCVACGFRFPSLIRDLRRPSTTRPSSITASGLWCCAVRGKKTKGRPAARAPGLAWRISGQLAAVNDHCDISIGARNSGGAAEEQLCLHACFARSPVSGFRCTAPHAVTARKNTGNDMMVATPGCRLVVRIFLPQQHLKTTRPGACVHKRMSPPSVYILCTRPQCCTVPDMRFTRRSTYFWFLHAPINFSTVYISPTQYYSDSSTLLRVR